MPGGDYRGDYGNRLAPIGATRMGPIHADPSPEDAPCKAPGAVGHDGPVQESHHDFLAVIDVSGLRQPVRQRPAAVDRALRAWHARSAPRLH